ncbi:L-fucose/L-arabinose isomerase family protein [Hoeflea prorocentri]|uniref:L-fucose isomerase C-terminal domain-containing protein n=1 Tax=Hoeflea prorocentri TaxID=1922333 RepID=A0A9X3ULR3_9HYPH|nr:hypothetical protein [Hoeflea prorocentri]MCY6383568.1 hypothetical protein [Hoeflea prorocentri]MDA5401368.1 hypothetical protein [Hoeflea prorocentri]
MKEVQTLGVLPLGRPTFDVAFAEEKLKAMLDALATSGKTLCGPATLLMDEAATKEGIEQIKAAKPDAVLILQVTFTDAGATMAAASAFDMPLGLWAVPEPRIGGRLRLNAFCGLNLASHALGRAGRPFSWMYTDPQSPDIGSELQALFRGERIVAPMDGVSLSPQTKGSEAVATLGGKRIARIGAHPDGFDTCRYDASKLKELTGIEVEELGLAGLFDTARAMPDEVVQDIRAAAERDLEGLESVNQEELDRSLRLKAALSALKDDGGYDAFAIRCWPETFTEYGGAVCGPVSMMGEARVPCACEADVYGAATQLLLQSVADSPVFLVDMVDMDVADDTGVVWHCGQAPISMADPKSDAQATIHTNRKMPLLYEFGLRPGRVTLMRLSQARGRHVMILAGAEMLERPMAFTGTSGVLRFDRPVSSVLPDIMNSGLEHHMALAYGDHGEALIAAAAALKLPVIRL